MIGDTATLAARFERFAVEAAEHRGALYAAIAARVAGDPELLAVAAEAGREPVPNTFFAAVHLLLQRPESRTDPLARFYGSVAPASAAAAPAPDLAFPSFREFVLARREEIVPILRTRVTQTNEVRRCSFLLPALHTVAAAAGGRPLAVIDVGCSAGLHLLWDRYRYEVGGARCGDPSARVTITCEARGPIPPPIPARFPPCTFRVGIDLSPIDVRVPAERAWLEALVWPDHAARRDLLRRAIDVAGEHPPPMVAGDALEVLPDVVAEVPPDAELCLHHCAALCQLPPADFARFREVVTAISAARPVHWLQAEGRAVRLERLAAGRAEVRHLANRDGHGRWLEWLEPPAA